MIPDAPTEVLVTHHEPLTARGILGTLALDAAFAGRFAPEPAAVDDAAWPRIVVADYDAGMALLQKFARQGACVVVVSARDTEFEVRHALECGARGYMTMNCTPELLLEGLHTVARGGRFVSKEANERLLNSFERLALTRREAEVLGLIAVGHPDKRIAALLDIATGTVKTHAKAILGKLGVASRTEAAHVARERGLLAPSVMPC